MSPPGPQPRKLTSGTWAMQAWSPPDPQGVCRRLFVTCPSTKNTPAFARELMRQAIERHVRGVPSSAHTFGSFVEECFLPEYPAARGLKASSAKWLRITLDRAVNILGHLPIGHVDGAAVARMVTIMKSDAAPLFRGKGTAPDTKINIRATVAELLAWALAYLPADTALEAATEMWLAAEWRAARERAAAEGRPKVRRGTMLHLKRHRFYLARYVLPAIGRRAIGDLVPASLPDEAFVRIKPDWQVRRDMRRTGRSAPRKAALSERTIRHHVVAVKSVLRWAHESRQIHAVPTIKIPRVSEAKTPTPYNADEARALFAAASSDEERALFLLAFDTGIRKSEVLGLTWSQIDYDTHAIRIDRQRYRGVEETTKSRKSRVVKMSTPLEALLRRIRHLRGPHVFCDEDGRPLTESAIRTAFERAVERAKIRKVRWHDHRHTFASIRSSEGMTPFAVQAAMGHEDIRTTQGYVHVELGPRPKSVIE